MIVSFYFRFTMYMHVDGDMRYEKLANGSLLYIAYPLWMPKHFQTQVSMYPYVHNLSMP